MRGLALLPLMLGAVLALAAPAPAATITDVTVNGEPQSLAAGSHLVMSLRPTAYSLNHGEVDLSPNHGESGWDLRFGPAPGHRLRRGVYDRAVPAPSSLRGHPGIWLSGGGRGCDSYGRFEVRDLRIAHGKLKRLWLVYEAYCGPVDAYGTFGEVRIHEPLRGPLTTVPRVARWPASDAKRPTTFTPILVVASRKTTLGRASIAGSRQFRIRHDGCRHRTLAAGERCAVAVRYRRTRPGTKRAKLRIRTSAGRLSVPLQSFAYGGVTRLALSGDKGDYVTQGRRWLFTLPRSDVLGTGTPTLFTLGATRGSDWFEAELAPAPGGRLRRGTYRSARRYPFNDDHPGFDLGGDGRGCDVDTGSFKVSEARYYRDHFVKSFAATLVQHCERAKPALRATLDWRAGDRARRPPWMPGRVVTRR